MSHCVAFCGVVSCSDGAVSEERIVLETGGGTKPHRSVLPGGGMTIRSHISN